MTFAAQTLRPWILSVGFGLFGWLVGVSLTNSSTPEVLCTVPPISPSSDESFVATDANGNITLRVENKPIAWVLEQIWLQSGKTLQAISSPQFDNSSQPTESVESTVASLPQTEDELLTKIQEGDESERYDNLALAQKKKIDLPDEILKTIYETDQSPHIRLLAYTYAMETFSGDSMALRNTLENARSLPDSAIADDAEQRLNVLARLEFERERAEYFTVQ